MKKDRIVYQRTSYPFMKKGRQKNESIYNAQWF